MEVNYKQIIKVAASEKLKELSKEFLQMLDEIKSEEESQSSKLLNLLAPHTNLDSETLKSIISLSLVLGEPKKSIIRKRILDKYNTLKRELEQ